MNETELGYIWDVSDHEGEAVAYIDSESPVSLTYSDLLEMLETLNG
jgi:hypothetical protein